MDFSKKNHGNLNKIKRAVRKITMQLVMASLILAFASCEKEEIFEPDQEIQEVDEAVKATAQIGAKLSLQIRRASRNTPYSFLSKNRTVWFNGSFWAFGHVTGLFGTTSQMRSSLNGTDWTFRKENPFPLTESDTKIVVHDGKMWAIGKDRARNRHIYSSSDGISWNLVTSRLPFSFQLDFDAVVFNNKIFVFQEDFYGGGQKIYSSFNGVDWTTENDDAFPYQIKGTPIVFKDTLYYMGGISSRVGVTVTNVIWQSTNGREWSQVSGATPNYLNPTEDFPLKWKHTAVVHNNAVWVTGGAEIEGDADQGRDIWVSGDMKNWSKYSGNVPFKPFQDATMLSYRNKILLLGGYNYTASEGYFFPKSIWSIKPRSRAWIPVEIPRKYPTIPGF